MRVVVLMSTYRGERHVREQVASILAQLPAEGRLIVRDDGSPDDTVAVLRAIDDPRLSVTSGVNIGFVASFLTLIAQSPPDAELVMLSDQDDVWLPNKIERAWDVIRASGSVPTLYCSRLRLVDADLHDLGLSPCWPREPSFLNALSENIVTGCTSALNPAAVDLLRSNGDTTRIYFHDWWIYLVVSAFGKVVFDPEPTILYRQHGSNAIGMGAGLSRYVTMLRFLRKRNWVHLLFNQAENFRAVHAQRLAPPRRKLLDDLFNPRDRHAVARLLLMPRRLRQTLVGDVLFRGLLAANLLTGRGLLPPR